eukprot:gene887-516_t
MGRKVRPKAIDVTRSTLQQTSATSILVELGDGLQSITATEEDVSPTQGSEQAFAQRRRGAVAESNKVRLCPQWRFGNCLERAACPHIHVRQLCDVGDNLEAAVQQYIANTAASAPPPQAGGNSSAGATAPNANPSSGSALSSTPSTAVVGLSGSGSTPGGVWGIGGLLNKSNSSSSSAPTGGTTWLEKLVPHKAAAAKATNGTATAAKATNGTATASATTAAPAVSPSMHPNSNDSRPGQAATTGPTESQQQQQQQQMNNSTLHLTNLNGAGGGGLDKHHTNANNSNGLYGSLPAHAHWGTSSHSASSHNSHHSTGRQMGSALRHQQHQQQPSQLKHTGDEGNSGSIYTSTGTAQQPPPSATYSKAAAAAAAMKAAVPGMRAAAAAAATGSHPNANNSTNSGSGNLGQHGHPAGGQTNYSGPSSSHQTYLHSLQQQQQQQQELSYTRHSTSGDAPIRRVEEQPGGADPWEELLLQAKNGSNTAPVPRPHLHHWDDDDSVQPSPPPPVVDVLLRGAGVTSTSGTSPAAGAMAFQSLSVVEAAGAPTGPVNKQQLLMRLVGGDDDESGDEWSQAAQHGSSSTTQTHSSAETMPVPGGAFGLYAAAVPAPGGSATTSTGRFAGAGLYHQDSGVLSGGGSASGFGSPSGGSGGSRSGAGAGAGASSGVWAAAQGPATSLFMPRSTIQRGLLQPTSRSQRVAPYGVPRRPGPVQVFSASTPPAAAHAPASVAQPAPAVPLHPAAHTPTPFSTSVSTPTPPFHTSSMQHLIALLTAEED